MDIFQSFDIEEIQDILTSYLAITIALILFNVNGVFGILNISLDKLLILGLITTFSVGIGFVFHELMHKFVAISFGHYARFQAFTLGIFLMLAMALLPIGFLFLAPGAVVIYSHRINKYENGIIALAGPLSNIFLVLLFILLSNLNTIYTFAKSFEIQEELLDAFFNYAISINLLLAFFNMIPFAILDGAKVFAWNKIVWLTTMLVIIILYIVLMI
ncbi:MAG: hypothetical protein QXO21_04695 [Candidatus Anstonellales archaeon]